jgi:hypothetical protein
MELVLSLVYHAISLYSRSLILDSRVSSPPPLSTDMEFHLFPAIFLLIDTLLLTPTPPTCIRKGKALSIFVVIIGAYWSWVSFCAGKNGWWAYPIIGNFGWRGRTVGQCAWVLVN